MMMFTALLVWVSLFGQVAAQPASERVVDFNAATSVSQLVKTAKESGLDLTGQIASVNLVADRFGVVVLSMNESVWTFQMINRDGEATYESTVRVKINEEEQRITYFGQLRDVGKDYVLNIEGEMVWLDNTWYVHDTKSGRFVRLNTFDVVLPENHSRSGGPIRPIALHITPMFGDCVCYGGNGGCSLAACRDNSGCNGSANGYCREMAGSGNPYTIVMGWCSAMFIMLRRSRVV